MEQVTLGIVGGESRMRVGLVPLLDLLEVFFFCFYARLAKTEKKKENERKTKQKQGVVGNQVTFV